MDETKDNPSDPVDPEGGGQVDDRNEELDDSPVPDPEEGGDAADDPQAD